MKFNYLFGQSKQPSKRASTGFFIVLALFCGGTALVREFQRNRNKMPSGQQPVVVASPVSRQSEAVRRVDELCASLPTPEQFVFVSKTAPSETAGFTSIAYTFRSSRAAEEIYPSFIVWFTQNGWTDNKTPYARLEFSKDNQTVWLAPYHTKQEGDFYTVSCTEWKIEPENISPPIKTPD